MGNLAGWSTKESGVHVAGLWGQFVQWCSMTGADPMSPGSISGFSQATGIDAMSLTPLVQQHGVGGPAIGGPIGNQLGGDELSGLSDRDLTLTGAHRR